MIRLKGRGAMKSLMPTCFRARLIKLCLIIHRQKEKGRNRLRSAEIVFLLMEFGDFLNFELHFYTICLKQGIV